MKQFSMYFLLSNANAISGTPGGEISCIPVSLCVCVCVRGLDVRKHQVLCYTLNIGAT